MKRVYKKTGKYFNCNYCKKQFYVYPSVLKSGWEHKYCSMSCRKKGDYNPNQKGELSSSWKGGRYNIKGYIYIKNHEHPFRNCGNLVAEHRIVMEKNIGRHLSPDEKVHHRNGIKDDNRIENLDIVSATPHHGNVKCPHCNEIFLIR